MLLANIAGHFRDLMKRLCIHLLQVHPSFVLHCCARLIYPIGHATFCEQSECRLRTQAPLLQLLLYSSCEAVSVLKQPSR